MYKKELLYVGLCGVVGGFLNGLFGSGAGVICVMMLRGALGDEQQAHATSTLVVLIMSVVSLTLYALSGEADYTSALRYLPGGVVGAVVGAIWLKNIGGDALRRLFGGIIAVSGVVMLVWRR